MDIQIDEKTPGFDQLKPGAMLNVTVMLDASGTPQVKAIVPAAAAEGSPEEEGGEDPGMEQTEDAGMGAEAPPAKGPPLKTTDDFYNHFDKKEQAKYPS